MSTFTRPSAPPWMGSDKASHMDEHPPVEVLRHLSKESARLMDRHLEHAWHNDSKTAQFTFFVITFLIAVFSGMGAILLSPTWNEILREHPMLLRCFLGFEILGLVALAIALVGAVFAYSPWMGRHRPSSRRPRSGARPRHHGSGLPESLVAGLRGRNPGSSSPQRSGHCEAAPDSHHRVRQPGVLRDWFRNVLAGEVGIAWPGCARVKRRKRFLMRPSSGWNTFAPEASGGAVGQSPRTGMSKVVVSMNRRNGVRKPPKVSLEFGRLEVE